jgi:hypothetical protein
LVGDGTSKIVVAQVQNSEVEQQGDVCWDDANKVVIVELKHSEVLESCRVEGM